MNSLLQVTGGLDQDSLIRTTCWALYMIQDQGGPVVLTSPAQPWSLHSSTALPVPFLRRPCSWARLSATPWSMATETRVTYRATLLRDLRCHITPSCVPSCVYFYVSVCLCMCLCVCPMYVYTFVYLNVCTYEYMHLYVSCLCLYLGLCFCMCLVVQVGLSPRTARTCWPQA